MASTAVRPSRIVIAAVVSAAIVVSAPFIGQLRSSLRSAFPAQYVTIVAGAVAALAAVAIGWALLRIRDRRALRYGALASALALAIGYSRWRATGRPDVDVVELFHFVEFGLVTWLFYRAWRPLGDVSIFVLPVLAGLIAGTADEWFQWFIPARVGEMNDVLLNLGAIGCGLLFSLGATPPERFSARPGPGSIARMGRLAALTVIAFAVFFHVVHLGHVVTDPEIGSFVSRYTQESLTRLDAGRRDEWRVRPLPTTLRRVSREDQYMTEGVVHVQQRNERLAAGHVREAWLENLILEKYYGSVLDAPSYVSRTGHRWPAEQRADLASRVHADPPTIPVVTSGTPAYVSDAYPYPIYTWRTAPFWAAVVALVLSILWFSRPGLTKQ
jgi:hypothetical protein